MMIAEGGEKMNNDVFDLIKDAKWRIGSYIAAGGSSNDEYVKGQIRKIHSWANGSDQVEVPADPFEDDMQQVFKNENGNSYLILVKDEDTRTMLLAQLDTRKFVVAMGVMRNSWGNGGYFDDFQDAYDFYKDCL